MTYTTNTTALNAALEASTAAWKAEIAAGKTGCAFNHLDALVNTVDGLDNDLAAETRKVAQVKTEAHNDRKLAAARTNDTTLTDRVAARRAARNAERKI